LPGEDALMRKEGSRIIIEPVAPRSLVALLQSLSALEDEFGPIDELPTDPVEL
jgi:antitoxin VapB